MMLCVIHSAALFDGCNAEAPAWPGEAGRCHAVTGIGEMR